MMSLWAKHMPEGMFLKSEGFASNLGHPEGRYTLGEYCAENETSYEYRDFASPIPLDTFARYGRWFAEHAVPHLREDRVEHVSQDRRWLRSAAEQRRDAAGQAAWSSRAG